jgi:protein gp37
MSDHTNIEWTDSTWNPLVGCSRVSAGCINCYAERHAYRFARQAGTVYEGTAKLVNGKPTFTGRVNLNPRVLDQPLRWKRPRRIFVNSMSDVFHESVSETNIIALFGIMAACPQHTFQVLTKRPERMQRIVSTIIPSRAQGDVGQLLHEAVKGLLGYDHKHRPAIQSGSIRWPLPNVWLGVSVEDQSAAAERIPPLLQTPAAIRFLSCEPLLGPIDLTIDGLVCLPCSNAENMRMDPTTGAYECCRACDYTGIGDEWGIDWVIAGGESGPRARPMHPDWARSLRDQCAAARVPFFFKQWGEYLAADADECDAGVDASLLKWSDGSAYDAGDGQRGGVHLMARVGKRPAGHLLDGVEHHDFPGAA